ncbi:MAG: hypothetical protein J0M15_11450 [Deltaproteobacteria bacterium]|jgi:hypothetical protein|nr:hypothetical protein [Deltaproteobacteria bacterium]
MKVLTKVFRVLFISVLFFYTPFILSSCGSEKDVDKIGNAQQCLNEATSSTAMDCVTKVDGLTSTGSYNIRCAAAFVREGFANPTKYTTAFDSLKGSSGTSGFMGLITFSSAKSIATDTANANTTFNDCFKAGAKGKTLISSFGYLSTALLNYFASILGTTECSTPSTSGYDLTSCIASAKAVNPATDLEKATKLALIVSSTESDSSDAGKVQSSVGSVIISTYTISCSGKGANQDLCDKLSASITAGGGTSSPRGVAISFFKTNLGLTF